MKKSLRVVTLGGGGGHAQVLKALRTIPNLSITGICPSTDSGGSTGILKEEYSANGYLGDLSRCVAALCPDRTLAKTLLYRYGNGSLSGHSLKNMLLLALLREAGEEKGLALFWNMCGIEPHRVLPVTRQHTQLCATLSMGNHIVSEAAIDTIAKNPLWHPAAHAIKDIYLKPKATATREVSAAIVNADWIIVCPGDLYSSIVPVLLPQGVKEACKRSDAQVAIVLNLVNKRGETDNYSAEDCVREIERRLGRRADVILVNTKSIPKRAAAIYALEEKIELRADASLSDQRVMSAPFLVLENGVVMHHVPTLRRHLHKLLVRKKTVS